MIPELAFSVLACARIGAIHSVVFAGFSSNALATRINDCTCKLVITADGGFRGTKTIDLKRIVDEALVKSPTIERVLVVKRTGQEIDMKEGRDLWLQPLLDEAPATSKAEVMDEHDWNMNRGGQDEGGETGRVDRMDQRLPGGGAVLRRLFEWITGGRRSVD